MKRAKVFIKFARETHALIKLYGDLHQGQTSIESYTGILNEHHASTLHRHISEGEQIIQEIAIKLINENIYCLSVDYDIKKINHFKFILAAYFDEMMIILSYNNHTWSNFLIEEKLFSTFISGEKLIKYIDDFINQHSAGDNALAFVYLYVLSFGYRGMLKNEIRKISKLKRQLLNILNHDFALSSEAVYTISANAYNNRIKFSAETPDTNYNTLYIKIIIAVVLLFFTIIAAVKAVYIDVTIT